MERAQTVEREERERKENLTIVEEADEEEAVTESSSSFFADFASSRCPTMLSKMEKAYGESNDNAKQSQAIQLIRSW